MTHVTRTPTTCCACFSRDTKRTPLGTYYCAPCYESARRFSRAKFGLGETPVPLVAFQSEGVDTVRAWRV